MSLRSRLARGLAKTRELLLTDVSDLVAGGRLDPGRLDELEDRLIEADLGFEAAAAIRERLEDEVRGSEARDPSAVLRVIAETLRDQLPEPRYPDRFRRIPGPVPHVILMAGVNGSGKTTTAGKMAHHYRSEGKEVLLAAADTYRAAAVEQLQLWAERTGADFVGSQEGADPAAVAYDAAEAASSRGIDVVLIDTAGRLHTRRELMEELRKIHRVLGNRLAGAPHESLLMLDATTGQNGIVQAEAFGEAVDVTGLVLTKLDGTARGGVIVPIVQRLGLPVELVGVGEDVEDLRPFDPGAFADGLMGEGGA
ncbi:MAG: signal recognition particle-docking protein FtsY [bacterium]